MSVVHSLLNGGIGVESTQEVEMLMAAQIKKPVIDNIVTIIGLDFLIRLNQMVDSY